MRILKYNFSKSKVFQFILIAIGETLLLFLGLFLALQVENWREAKNDRELEMFSLNALNDEMQFNKEELNLAMEYHARSRKALEILMTITLENYTILPSRTIDSLLAEAQWAWTFNPRMGVIKTIISTGQIKNIHNQDLRMFITSFEDLINDSQEESAMNNKLIIEQYIPIVNQYVGEGNRGKYLGFNVKESRFKSNYIDLFSNRELESLLAYMYVWRVDQQTEEKIVYGQIVKGLEVLERELDTTK
jgi:hypothetical protein